MRLRLISSVVSGLICHHCTAARVGAFVLTGRRIVCAHHRKPFRKMTLVGRASCAVANLLVTPSWGMKQKQFQSAIERPSTQGAFVATMYSAFVRSDPPPTT